MPKMTPFETVVIALLLSFILVVGALKFGIEEIQSKKEVMPIQSGQVAP
jgi:hypothetical protein